ncbi:hypothetical protein MRX96_012445 [Rhipicephalus microplus]
METAARKWPASSNHDSVHSFPRSPVASGEEVPAVHLESIRVVGVRIHTRFMRRRPVHDSDPVSQELRTWEAPWCGPQSAGQSSAGGGPPTASETLN